MTHDLWALCGHMAYSLILLSFLVRKILWLRTLSIAAGIFSICYNYTISSTPLWTPIQWNLVFMATNLYQIYSIFKEKQDITFEGYEKVIFENVFHGFLPYQFKKIINLAHINGCRKDQQIIKQEDLLEELYLIIKGSLSIEVNDQFIIDLNEGNFVGDMSFITGESTRANVFSNSDEVRILSWNIKELKNLLAKEPELNSLFTATLGRQLITQLMDKSIQDETKSQLNLVA
jgi:hypothetical protein